MITARPDEKLTGVRPALPWATVAVALLAVLAWIVPAMSGQLIYDRTGIFGGQIWRAWTGHAVHFGGNHMLWNLAIFIPAGCWLERLWPATARWFLAVGPFAISLALLGLDPSLLQYAGLSGLATGILVLLSGLQLRRAPAEPAWFWLGVLLLVGGKLVIEHVTGTTLLVDSLTEAGVRNVPLAHLGGVACAVGFWLVAEVRNRAVPKMIQPAGSLPR